MREGTLVRLGWIDSLPHRIIPDKQLGLLRNQPRDRGRQGLDEHSEVPGSHEGRNPVINAALGDQSVAESRLAPLCQKTARTLPSGCMQIPGYRAASIFCTTLARSIARR